MFEYKGIIVPFEVVGRAYHITITEAEEQRNPEYWDTGESRRFRELLRLQTVPDEDKLRRLAIHFRKKPVGKGGWIDYKKIHGIKGKAGGNGRGNAVKVSPELQAHYDSQHYAELKDTLLNGRQCVVCSSPCEQGHHCRYDRINTPEEYNDVVPVCKKCHPVLDKLRKKNSPKR